MKTVIHVGLPKAASTFLQKCYFPQVTNFVYYSSYSLSAWPSELGWLFELNTSCDKIQSTQASRTPNQELGIDIAGWLETGKLFIKKLNRPLLLSSEGLCGVGYNPVLNNNAINNFLKSLFGDAKIIFFFRSQADYCESLYKQLIFTENRFRRYIKFADLYAYRDGMTSLVDVNALNWATMVKNYYKTFGANNVLAIPYELFRNDNEQTINDISAFIGVNTVVPNDLKGKRENVSATTRNFRSTALRTLLSDIKSFSLGRNQSSLMRRVASSFGDLLKACYTNQSFAGLTTEKDEILNRVMSANKELESLVGIDLKGLGYY